jgi:hypothetical protein
MPLCGRKLRAIIILLVILTVLLLLAFSANSLAAKATATPKPTVKSTPAPTPTPTPVPQICILTGRVVDSHGNGISGAKVTLYNMTISDGKLIDTGLTTVDPNPQYTRSGDTTNAGYYQFTGVPSGTYDIIVDINGMRYPEVVMATRGTVTKDFVITPVDNMPSTTVTPAATAVPEPGSGDPIVTVIPADPTPAESSKNDDPLVLRAGIGVLIVLQFMVACVVIGLYMTRRL